MNYSLYIHADGTLYFSSNGHEGYGGLDLYTVQNIGGSWGTLVNMATPFNSEKDDFGFISLIAIKRMVIFLLIDPGGLGRTIFTVFYSLDGLDKTLGTEVSEPRAVSVYVSDFSTGEMIDSALVTYAILNDQAFTSAINTISKDEANLDEILLRLPLNGNSASGITDSWGKYPLELAPGSHVILVSKYGYEAQQVIFNTVSDDTEIFVSLEKESEKIETETSNDAVAESNKKLIEYRISFND